MMTKLLTTGPIKRLGEQIIALRKILKQTCTCQREQLSRSASPTSIHADNAELPARRPTDRQTAFQLYTVD